MNQKRGEFRTSARLRDAVREHLTSREATIKLREAGIRKQHMCRKSA